MNRIPETQTLASRCVALAIAGAVLGIVAAPATADLLEDAKNAASRLNNLGDLGRGVAESAATQARQQAEQVWALSRAPASQQRAAAEASLADAKLKWIEYQQRVTQQAARQGAQLQTNLETDFPELARASAATANYGYGFALGEVQVFERVGTNVLNRLVQLDQKYKLSASVRRAYTVDFARDYPELDALGRSPVCSPIQFTTMLRAHRPRIGEAIAQLQAMDRKYQAAVSQQLEAFSPGTLYGQLERSLQMRSCQAELQIAGDAGERDARLLLAYFNELLGRVHGVAASPISNQNSQLAARINGETQALIVLVGATVELVAAEVAVRQASKQIDDDKEEIGRSGSPGIRSLADQYRTYFASGRPKGNDDILDTPADVDKMGRDIDKLNRDYEIYKQAAARRNRALFALIPAMAEVAGRTVELGRTLAAASTARDPNQDALIAMSQRFPSLRAPAASGQGLVDCVNRQAATWLQTDRMFDDALTAFRAMARQKAVAAANLVPQDIKSQLTAAIRAGNDLARTMDMTDRVVVEAGSAAQVYTGEFANFANRAAGLMSTGNADALVRELGDLNSGLSPRINELAERAVAAKEYADESGAKSRTFAVALSNLKRVILAQGGGAAADLVQLVDNLGVSVVLAMRPDLPAFVQCAQQKRQLYAAMAPNLIRRVAEYIPRRAQALAAMATSPAVMQAVDRCTASAKDFLTHSGALVHAVDDAGHRAYDYKNAYAALMASMVPIPQPVAAQRLQAANERLEALRAAATQVSQRGTPAQGSLDALAACVEALKVNVLGPQGGPFLEDAASLVFPRVDIAAYPGRLIASGNRMVADLQAIAELGRLWSEAVRTFPARFAAVETRGALRIASAVDPALARRLEGMLNESQGFVAGCVNCLNRATATGTQLTVDAAQLSAKAVADAIGEMQGLVSGAAGRLSGLLVAPLGNRPSWRERGCAPFDARDMQGKCWAPNTPSDDDFRGAIAAANTAADAVARVGENAARRFQILAAARVSQIQGDVACVGQQANFVLAKANEVRSVLANTVVAPVMMMAQPVIAAGQRLAADVAGGRLVIPGGPARVPVPAPLFPADALQAFAKGLPPAPLPPAQVPPPNRATKGPIGKADRALLVLSTGLRRYGRPEFGLLYQFLESSGVVTARNRLSDQYARVQAIEGSAGTFSNFYMTLHSMACQYRSVDLIIHAHGQPGAITFEDGAVETDSISYMAVNGGTMTFGGKEITFPAIPAQCRANLRAAVETACYGATHMNDWRKAGFSVAVGSRGVYADSAASFPAFLNYWAAGYPMQVAIEAANNADPARVLDTFASKVFKFPDVNSFRVIDGRGDLDISSATAR